MSDKQKLLLFLLDTQLVPVKQAEEIADRFIYRPYQRGDFFLREGKISNEYLFLEKGFMRAFAYDTEGNDITTNLISSNQMVLEVSSFFYRKSSKENIVALTECEGWFLDYKELNQLFHEMPEFREFGRHILVRAFSTLKSRMLSMITESAEERYVHLLDSNPEIFTHAPLKNIASYLGITDTSLSRIRREFSKR